MTHVAICVLHRAISDERQICNELFESNGFCTKTNLKKKKLTSQFCWLYPLIATTTKNTRSVENVWQRRFEHSPIKTTLIAACSPNCKYLYVIGIWHEAFPCRTIFDIDFFLSQYRRHGWKLTFNRKLMKIFVLGVWRWWWKKISNIVYKCATCFLALHWGKALPKIGTPNNGRCFEHAKTKMSLST